MGRVHTMLRTNQDASTIECSYLSRVRNVGQTALVTLIVLREPREKLCWAVRLREEKTTKHTDIPTEKKRTQLSKKRGK